MEFDTFPEGWAVCAALFHYSRLLRRYMIQHLAWFLPSSSYNKSIICICARAKFKYDHMLCAAMQRFVLRCECMRVFACTSASATMSFLCMAKSSSCVLFLPYTQRAPPRCISLFRNGALTTTMTHTYTCSKLCNVYFSSAWHWFPFKLQTAWINKIEAAAETPICLYCMRKRAPTTPPVYSVSLQRTRMKIVFIWICY